MPGFPVDIGADFDCRITGLPLLLARSIVGGAGQIQLIQCVEDHIPGR